MSLVGNKKYAETTQQLPSHVQYTSPYQSQFTLPKCKWSRQLLQSERGLPISNSLFGTLPQDNGNSNRHKNNNNNNNNNNDDVKLRNPKPQSLFLSNITFHPDLYLLQFHLITSLHGVSSVWAPSQLQGSHQSSHFWDWFKEWTSHKAFSDCLVTLKTHPGNAIENQSDKLVAGKVAFADLGSCFLTSDLVFWATFVQFPQISLANAKTQTQ